MDHKVILISIDGMRPDGALACGHPFVQQLMSIGSYALDAKTVFPSVTLPCHMSMFHSVPPERHGMTTNIFMPQVHPVRGLFEQISSVGGSCAMYYGWEPLRDISRPGSLRYAEYIHSYAEDATDGILTDRAEGNKRKFLTVASVIINLSALIFFKYTDFFITNINNWFGTAIPLLHLTLPLGISFYTFQTLS